ncbi:hypothetical protein GQ602_004259 [Ophiocordyceps camponoti-floridani]|uniref:Uncharacterized protein n=1 Tax=Ophiocordyceps camponoti-floridani TaxID=2030778 RepID=A0A8H4Q6Y6_9HYPO|nr:hypothetical protein GQ602_004259 [Ophiocordyceps camponoti-floridani]
MDHLLKSAWRQNPYRLLRQSGVNSERKCNRIYSGSFCFLVFSGYSGACDHFIFIILGDCFTSKAKRLELALLHLPLSTSRNVQ